MKNKKVTEQNIVTALRDRHEHSKSTFKTSLLKDINKDLQPSNKYKSWFTRVIQSRIARPLIAGTSLMMVVAVIAVNYAPKTPENIVDVQKDFKLASSMETFASDEEFDNTVKEFKPENLFKEKLGLSLDSSENKANVAAPNMDAAKVYDTSTNANITNNQETQVDEGDIVKNYKDYLIVLRRGRLFTIRINDRDREVLTPIAKANVYPSTLKGGGWYDEMLISGNKIIVVGYRYSQQATEIAKFTIKEDGELEYNTTHFLSSNDYYSSNNYTSRLVDGELVFYMPSSLWSYASRQSLYFPTLKKWSDRGELIESQELLRKRDIYKPVQEVNNNPTLHTIVRCSFESNLDCSAKAILGSASRTYYVSNNAVYLWMPSTNSQDAYLYSFLLKNFQAGYVQTYGMPIDQFSFKESQDGYLNVVVNISTNSLGLSSDDIIYKKRVSSLNLLRFPITEFSREGKTLPQDFYQNLPNNYSYTLKNKFIGNSLVYGDSAIYVKDLTSSRFPQKLEVSSSIDRIEALDTDVLIVGQKGRDTVLSLIDIDQSSVIRDTYTLTNTTQSERRSHAFFYKQYRDGTGILGLPTFTNTSSSRNYYGSSSINFMRVSKEKRFENLKELVSTPSERNVLDSCEVSCTDWYGNSRPIFYNDRIFALMGYELIEGVVERGAISEVERVNYLK
jgi:hypothetical protein